MEIWQDRIVGRGEAPPGDLIPNTDNFRVHPWYQQQAFTGMAEQVGLVQTVIVNRTTGHLIDGHMRVALALRHDVPTVPVTYVELSADEEAIALATYDAIRDLADTSRDQFVALIGAAREAVPALTGELTLIRERMLQRMGPSPDAAPEAGIDHIATGVDATGEHRTASIRQIVLEYSAAEYEQLMTWIEAVGASLGAETHAEAILTIVARADDQLAMEAVR